MSAMATAPRERRRAILRSLSPTEVLSVNALSRLTGVSGDDRDIRLELLPSVDEEAALPVAASVSTKPGISLLWLACVLVVLGGLTAARRMPQGKGGGSEREF